MVFDAYYSNSLYEYDLWNYGIGITQWAAMCFAVKETHLDPHYNSELLKLLTVSES